MFSNIVLCNCPDGGWVKSCVMKQQSEEEEPGAEHDHKASQERALSEREQSHGDSSTADFSVCNQVQG